MKNQTVFAVIGGDMRQGCLAGILKNSGYEVIVCGLSSCPELPPEVKRADVHEAVRGADVIILPLPVSRDGAAVNAPFSSEPIYLNDILSDVSKGQMITGGIVSEKFAADARDREALVTDYFDREELAVLNAIPTAEGALETAMRESRRTIYGSSILISGYGRIGRVLTRMLLRLGADVCVSLRKQSDKAWALAEGAHPIFVRQIEEYAPRFDTVFNTVPHMIFDSTLISKFKPRTLFIDLASPPGGIDLEAARIAEMTAISAQSLPGKCAPLTAAEFIKETIFNIMEENGASPKRDQSLGF